MVTFSGPPLSVLFFEECPTSSVLIIQHVALKQTSSLRWDFKPRERNAGEMQQNGMKPKANGKNEQHMENVGGRESIKIATTSDMSRNGERQRK